MTTRRSFVKKTALASAAVILPRSLHALASRQASTAETIRVGLVGCGGRGTGAARDAMRAADNIEIIALGDLFADRLEACKANLTKAITDNPALAPKYKVDDEHCFTGFDAYQKVLASDIDLVILATPPVFRPAHLAAAVAAGKHVFMEKPVAVDPAGVRSVIASSELAARKKLAIVAGTQRRHEASYLAAVKRVHDGAIGDVVSGQVIWNQGGLWHKPREPQWSDVEWQLRNWLYFTWASGDHIVEQHIHNIDVANWVVGSHPVKAVGVGGRQSRTDAKFGHIYDHFAIDFEYPNGARVLSMCRQIDGCANHIGEHFIGTLGRTDAKTYVEGRKPWRLAAATPQGADGRAPSAPNPYVQEHVDLVASIRAGTPLNEGRQVAESTLSAIMGREAAYTGQVIAWDELLNSTQDIVPPNLAFGPLKVPGVAMPGQTKLNRTWADE